MAKELPIIAAPQSTEEPVKQDVMYTRVFCKREDTPPLKLLLDFLRAKNQTPLIASMDPEALEDWDWTHVSIGYHRERKPLQLFCVRNKGTYKDVFETETLTFQNRLSPFDHIEAQIAKDFVRSAHFIATTQLPKSDITDEGYDFNGWILEFFQENCDGIVQIDDQGFYSPKGDLIVDMEEADETNLDGSPTKTGEA
ncbi:MAG: hypothetical protein MRJ96_04455 [Nitrospirales bacterium]|nr:hypothetical protein [Nitrospira sp.]MDR4500693.1 hypothetical protein [Nitrospirales bacterium]